MGISDRFRPSQGIDPTAVVGRRIIAWLLDNLFMAIVVLVVHRGDVRSTPATACRSTPRSSGR